MGSKIQTPLNWLVDPGWGFVCLYCYSPTGATCANRVSAIACPHIQPKWKIALFKKNFLKIILFIFGCAGCLLLHELFSSCGQQGLLSSCNAQVSPCGGFWLQSTGRRACRLAQLRLRPLEHRLSSCGAVAPHQMGSSQIRDELCISFIGRWIFFFFFTTGPQGSPRDFFKSFYLCLILKHKLESRLLGEISVTSDMQMTSCRKAKKNQSLLMNVKEKSEKVGLKLNIQ